MTENTIISIEHLTKSFGEKTVLEDINLDIRQGEFVTLLGPSGCGKTTLLRHIAGFLTPSSGRILLDGKDISQMPPHLRPLNTVFQRYALFPHLNVFDNIAFGLKLKGMKKEEIAREVKRVLKIVGMTEYEMRDVNSLSGGQQQRVAIARAIVNKPKVLLLDEPLAALDLKMRKDMQMELKEMHSKLGITFIYVTHDQEEALTLSDRIVVLNESRIQQIGAPQDIYNEPSNSFVADFIGESNILNGMMIRDRRVKFINTEFDCVDEGLGECTEVDVVVRPEDIYVLQNTANAQFKGRVKSCIFKGVHYEMFVETPDGFELMIQDYNQFEVGSEVGMLIKPSDIHVMRKERTCNSVEGEMVSQDTVRMLDAEFSVEPREGLQKGDRVRVSFDFGAVDLMDNEEDGTATGTIRFILYKGDRYHLTVKTSSGENIYVDTQDVWEDLDDVGVNIAANAIRLTKIIG